MNLIFGILGVALTVALALVVILSIGPLKRAVGLGSIEVSGLPATLAGISGGGAAS